MSSKYNIIGHLYNPSKNNDKVYMSCIRFDHGEWKVIGKWGRREKGLSSMVKGTFKILESAFDHQRKLWHEKSREGYKDIDGSEYLQDMKSMSAQSSIVTRNTPGVKENLESETPELHPIQQGMKICSECGVTFAPDSLNSDLCQKCQDKKAVKDFEQQMRIKELTPQEYDMYCIDNSGMDNFDLGVEYVVESIVGNNEMMNAYDKYGNKVEVFRDRFASKEQMEHRSKFGFKTDSIFFKVMKEREVTNKKKLVLKNWAKFNDEIDKVIEEEFTSEEIKDLGQDTLRERIRKGVAERVSKSPKMYNSLMKRYQ